MLNRLRVILADDHNLFREGVASLLARDHQVEVVGQASDTGQILELVAFHEPDVLLLDVEMPGGSARATIGTVRRASPNTKIIVLTMHRDAILRKELLAAGAVDYLTKTVPAADLLTAIHAAAAASASDDAPPESARQISDSEPAALLSDREVQVLRLIARALPNAAIADRLQISRGTVKRHANNIYRKLGATSRMDAVRRGARLGVLDQ